MTRLILKGLNLQGRHLQGSKSAAFVLALFSLVSSHTSFADSKTEPDIYSLSLEELLNTKVVSASKKEESIATAPAVVSVFTRADIDDNKVKSVSEALGIMTGVFSYETYLAYNNLIAFRNNFGGEHYISKVLFLINGHPIQTPLNGAVKLNTVPIEAVERIEVIRGPVSVLYGTNALTGVVNVITRKGQNENGTQMKFTEGSNPSGAVNLTTASNAKDFKYFFSATVHEDEGYDFIVKPEQDEATIGVPEKQYEDDTKSLFTTLTYKNLDLDLSYMSSAKSHKIGVLPDSRFTGEGPLDAENYYFDLRYRARFNDKILLHYKLRYDKFDLDFKNNGIYLLENTVFGIPALEGVSDGQSRASRTGGEMYAEVELSKLWDLNVGVAYDEYESEALKVFIDEALVISGVSPISNYADIKEGDDLAVYVNTNVQATEKLSLTAGVRETDNNIAGVNTSYRSGLIYQLKESLIIKALYASSFRSANFAERYTDSVPILRGDENLKNETLTGFDLGIYFTGKTTVASANYYINTTKDFIKRQDVIWPGVPVPVPTYVNVEGEETTGIEVELKHFFNERWSTFINGTHSISAEDEATGEELTHVVKNMTNVGFNYKYDATLTFNFYNQYRSSWAKSPSFSLANLSVTYQPRIYKDFEAYLGVNNLTDEEYTYAEVSRKVLDTIPGGPPRTFFVGFQYSF